MAIVSVEELSRALPREGRLMALDLGSKTVGIAVSDLRRSLATPLRTLARGKFSADAAALFAVYDTQQAKALILGLPLNMDGSEGPRCQSTRQFAANLLRLRDLPVALQDERLSSAGAERRMIEDYDLSRSKRADRIDAAAAAWILEAALARLAHLVPGD